jgi:hypothetical protein
MGPDYKEISETWNGMIKTLKSHGPKKFQDPEFLVRSHAAVTWGSTIRENQLAGKYRDYFMGETKLDEGIEKLKPVDFAKYLRRLAEVTIGMCSESEPGNPFVFASRFLGAVQHFPLLLAANIISDNKVKQHFLEQVGTRALLQVFSKEHPPHVEGIYPAWAHEVAKVGRHVTIEDLNRIYKSHAFARGDTSNLTKEQIAEYKKERIQALGAQVDSWQYNSSSKRKIRAALSLVSWWTDDELEAEHAFNIGDYLRLKTASTRKTWHIDHILANGYKDSKISSELRNSIGNLVLLEEKKNIQAQDVAPVGKSEIYTTKSSLTFTHLTNDATHKTVHAEGLKRILKTVGVEELKWSLKKWDSDSIINRKEFIKKILMEIVCPKY